MKKIIFLLFVSIAIPLMGLEVDPEIYPDTDVDALSSDAVEICSSIDKFKKDKEKFLRAESDYHAVFELDMKKIISVLSDYDNGENIFSRMKDMRKIPAGTGEDPDVSYQWVHGSVKFLGIGQDYIYTNIVTLDKNTDVEYVQHWIMVDCEKGNFEKYEGFWYLQRLVPVEGRPRTYVRLYAETIFNNVIPFQETIMKMFTKSETEDVFKAVLEAAQKYD